VLTPPEQDCFGQFGGSAKIRTLQEPSLPNSYFLKASFIPFTLSLKFPLLMDAASAIIGFTASLTTLVGLVIESAKTLYKAQSSFKEAPRDIRRLSRQIFEFEALLRQVQSQINVECNPQTSAIYALINTSAQHMQDDLREFDSSFKKVKSILDEPANSKLFGIRIRHILTESKVTRYQQLISSYSGTLTLFLALINK
jgi:hypothetical protein